MFRLRSLTDYETLQNASLPPRCEISTVALSHSTTLFSEVTVVLSELICFIGGIYLYVN